MIAKKVSQLLVLACLHFWCLGQQYDFKKVSLADGLSQSSITAIAQDKRGFLWVGTQDGLNRYDGYEFTVFKKKAFDSTSLATNFVTSLLIDENDNLWVGTLSGGLHLFQPKTQDFIRFKPVPGDSTSLIHENITTLYEDKDGNIWAGTARGLCTVKWWEKKHNPIVKFEHIEFPKESGQLFPSDKYTRQILLDSKNKLWVGTLNGLFCFQKTLSNQLVFLHKTFLDQRITAICEDAKGNILVGMKTGLYRLPENEDQFQYFEDGIESLEIYDIELIQNNDLIVATNGGVGILQFNNGVYNSVFEKYEVPSENSERPSEIKTILEDEVHPNLFWLGTPFSGLRKMQKRVQQFHANLLNDVPGLSLNPSVKTIVKDTINSVWLVLEQGILKYYENEQRYQFYSDIQIDNLSLPASSIQHLWTDATGNIFGGTFGHGLLHLEESENSELNAAPYFTSQSCDDDAVFSFLELENGYLLGTYSGLNYLDKAKGTLFPCSIPLDSINSEKLNYRVNDIMLDSSKNLWLGTSYGLVLLESAGLDFPNGILDAKPTFFRNEDNNPESLIDDDVHHVFQDSRGRIWLGTTMGLVKVNYSPNGCRFEVFNEQYGLPNANILAIMEDELNKELWISTSQGISRFDPLLNYFFNFDVSDGLQSKEFKSNVFFKTEDGEMYFGGVNGYTRFDPQSIQMLAQPPPVWISELRTLDGEQYNLLNKHSQRSVALGYRQNSFTISFTGIDYLHPQALQYFYDFEGGGAQNVPIDEARKVSFSNLKPGAYKFRVRALSKDRALNNEGDEITIFIAAPFWQTTSFYGMLILLFAGLMWLVFNIRYSLKMKRLAEIERVRRDAAEDFHDELGSKLTVISMYSELTRRNINGNDETTGKYLEKVIDTSNSLYGSMKDLLWALNPEKDSLDDLFLELKKVGNELFEDSNINFSSNQLPRELKKEQLPIQIKRHVLLIFKEVMNNTLKHANCSAAHLDIRLKGNTLFICFKDNGKGFDFEPKDAGAGLVNIQNRARKIAGNLTIISNPKGTQVNLICPIQE